MGMKLMKQALSLLLACMLDLGLAGCSARASSGRNQQELQRMANEFIEEIASTLLPYREDPPYMALQGAVTVTKGMVDGTSQEITYGWEYLENFQSSLNREEDCQVTVVFSTSALVISRICFVDGQGYYMRYQFEQNGADEVKVVTKLVDSASINWENQPDKVDIELLYGKATIASFTLRNLIRILADG